jgi:hypothetical protein
MRLDNSGTFESTNLKDLKFKKVHDRKKTSIAPPSSISKPNQEDILRRVATVLYQHILNCEQRHADLEFGSNEQANKFAEENFVASEFKLSFFRSSFLTQRSIIFSLQQQESQVSKKFNLKSIHELMMKVFANARLSGK